MTSTKKISIKSPLRYPGGKARLVKQILAMAPEDYSEYREPFLGGGSVLFAVHNSKPDILKRAGDSFEPLYEFWNCCKTDFYRFERQVKLAKKTLTGKDCFEQSRRVFFDPSRSSVLAPFMKAAAYFVLNRITFSGLTLSGGYSKEAHETRFRDTHIARLKDANQVLQNVDLRNSDYTELLHEPGDNVWIYLDPPYDIKSDNLYGKSGASHKGFDHVRFAEECKSCKHKWLITYNDNEKIRDLYSSWANIVEVPVKYSMNSKAKVTKELFITNY